MLPVPSHSHESTRGTGADNLSDGPNKTKVPRDAHCVPEFGTDWPVCARS